MIIFARQNDFGYFSTGDEKDPIILGPYSENTAINNIVDNIFDTWVSKVGDDIECLFLVSHGNAGTLRLGIGVDASKALSFGKLKICFAANCRGIEIHGCASASATSISIFDGTGTPGNSPTAKGYHFLHKLASSTGVKVTAPIDSISGFNAAYSYDGVRTMTVYPSGSSYFTIPDSPIKRTFDDIRKLCKTPNLGYPILPLSD